MLANEAAFALEIGDRAQAISKWAELGSILIDEIAPSSDKYQRWQKVMLHLLEVYAEVYVETNPIQESLSHPVTLKIQSLNQDNSVHVASVKTPTKNALPSIMAFNPPQKITNEGFIQQLDLPLDSGIAIRTVRIRLESNESTIMLHLKPIAKLVDRAVGEYREAIAVEPAIHAKFDQTVYWNTGKKGSIGYSIYSKDGGEYSWGLILARPAWGIQDGFINFNNPQDRQINHTLVKKTTMLNAGWNHFTEEVPRKWKMGSIWFSYHQILKLQKWLFQSQLIQSILSVTHILEHITFTLQRKRP